VVDDGGFHDPGPVGRFVARNGFAAHHDALSVRKSPSVPATVSA
jgi:dihydropyrimidinase